MKIKRKITTRILMIIVVAMFIISTAVVLAAPTIRLTVTTNENTANLSWTNSDSTGSYSYRVLRSINDGPYNGLSATNTEKVKVLNVYPSVGPNITFTSSADGRTYTVPKGASLKRWMEEPNGLDSRGFGRGLITVDAISTATFNSNPANYLKQVNGKYNYDVIMFGTWDNNSSEDITAAGATVVENFIKAGGAAIFGHDTINQSSRNFARLAGYVNGTYGADSSTQTSGAGTCKVQIVRDGVITKYPWNIGGSGTQLTVPQTHSWSIYANGTIWMNFVGYPASTKNFYLTTYNNCAIVQTGHSSCESTTDEQKILANLIFYLADVKVSTNEQDKGFIDINTPNKPSVQSSTSNGTTGTVTYTATDNGTKYNYYVEATNNATQEITTSNIETRYRTTGVAGYSYVIDENEETEVDNTIDTTSTSINYTIGNGPNTYLHIKAIDGAGNVGETLHILIHSNIAPELTLTQNITEWTNGNVIITATGTDSDGRVVSIKKPNGTVVNSASTTYEVTQNGTYEFTATDNSGATTTKSIKITNIDKVKPNATTNVTQPTTTVRGATISISATDDASGVAKIVKPDGTEVTNATTTYVVTKPGTYTFTVVDVAGNEREIEVPVVIVSDGVEVRFIDQVTKNEIDTRVSINGNVEDTYTTEAKVIDDYELVLTPENATGKFAIDKTIVTYEYRKNSNVTVKYIDDNYNTNIIDDIVTKYKEGDAYTTEEKTFEGYALISKTYNTSGMIARDDITVEYRYKKISAGVEIKYIDQVTGEEIAEKVIKTGLEKMPYTTIAKEIFGYELVKIPENATGEMKVEKTTVIYEYRKNSYVTTKYINENNGYVLSPQSDIKYKEGDTYTTVGIDIDGYTITKIDGDETGTVGKEDIIVTYYYKKNTSVVVKYVDMLDNNREIAEEVTISGLQNDDYETEEKKIPGYTFVEVEGIANGKMGYDTREVIYKYKKASNLITEHRNANTNEKIIDDVVKAYKEGDAYEAHSQKLDGYILVQEPDEKTGVMGREDVIKTFYYKRISEGLVVRYVDRLTNEVLDRVVYEGNENDKITLDEKTFLGYVLDERPNYDEVMLGAEAQEITFYYKKAINLNVVGIDQETGENIYSTIVSGVDGDSYRTTPRIIDGYELVRTPENHEGIFNRENTKVIYEYRKIGARVVAKYIDKETNQELDSYTITGKVGENYKTERKKFDNYTLVEVVGQEVGTLSEETKEVIYYYERKNGKVIVTYEDENGNELLKEELTGKVGEDYNVIVKDIIGYEVVEIPENTSGKYEEITKELVIKLQKIEEKGTVVVKYIDKDGNEILKEELTGKVGEDYNVTVKEIPGYDLVEVPDNITGKYENGTIEVIVKVEEEPIPVETGKVVIKYIDENGNEVLKEEMSGNVGEDYEVNIKEIPGYDIVEIPDNTTGKYEEGTIEVIIKVEEEKEEPIKQGTVVVKYIDEDGKEILKEEMVGNVGEKYNVSIKDIPGYEIIEIPTNTTGKYEEKTVEVIIKVKEEKEEPIKQGTVVVKYVDENGNEVLREELTGKVDEYYHVNVKDIPGYKIKEIPQNTNGKYENEQIEVIIKIEKEEEKPIEKGKVVVKYIDENGNEVLKEEMAGNIGEDYKVNIKDISGYDIIEIPDNTAGKYEEGTIEVIVKVADTNVKPINQGIIKIKHIDENGNIIKEDYIEDGEIGKYFIYDVPEINGYKIIGDKKIEAQFVDGKLIFEAKYEKITESDITNTTPEETNPIDLPNTGDINLVLYVISFIVFGGILLNKFRFQK